MSDVVLNVWTHIWRLPYEAVEPAVSEWAEQAYFILRLSWRPAEAKQAFNRLHVFRLYICWLLARFT